jgi:2-methylcitrate dehydratase PrpD
VEARARLCVADHLHAAMHGARSDTGKLLRRYLGWDANHIPAPLRRSRRFVRGAISAVHEIDDVHQDTSLHPGSVVVAAAMAAAAEAMRRSRDCWRRSPRLRSGGALEHCGGSSPLPLLSCDGDVRHGGARAAAATVFDLDEEATAHAIGIAATSASGLWEGINDEAVTIKHLHPGWPRNAG